MNPLKRPISAPVRSPARMASSGLQPCFTLSTAITPAASPLTAPTDRSISPSSRTSTTPTEIVPIAAIWSARFVTALKGCDVALVIGVPLDFRLGFGASIGEEATLVQLDFAPSKLDKTRRPDFILSGDIGITLSAIRESAAGKSKRTVPWIE